MLASMSKMNNKKTSWKLAALVGAVGLVVGGGAGAAIATASSSSADSTACLRAVEAGDEVITAQSDFIGLSTDIDRRFERNMRPTSAQLNELDRLAEDILESLGHWAVDSTICRR